MRNKNIIIGALAGTIIASTYALLGSRPSMIKQLSKQTQDWADKARNVSENVIEDVRHLTESRRSRSRKTFVQGTLLGLLIGAGTAALLTPRSGKQLRNQLSNRYQDVADITQDLVKYINQNGYRKPLKNLSKTIAKKKRQLSRSR